jgi:hypothetical protein
MVTKLKNVLLLGIAALMANGCATIMTGTTEKIRFTSTPPGATAKVASGQEVTTPGDLDLQRDRSYEVRFEKEGCLPARRSINQTSNNWFIGNVLLGGLIGMLVDSSNGAAYHLEPRVVDATLPGCVDHSDASTGQLPSAQ